MMYMFRKLCILPVFVAFLRKLKEYLYIGTMADITSIYFAFELMTEWIDTLDLLAQVPIHAPARSYVSS
jgi:hypothetical protein